MTDCSLTNSEESRKWPEGITSVKLTMNPYLLVLAEDKAAREGLKLWEYINLALFEKIGRPSKDELLDFAATFELDDLDPKWKHRLKLTARYEVEVRQATKHLGASGDSEPSDSIEIRTE
ncbi:MAG: hypothetical protein M1511_11070 [Deltaproteobacteria bacterium]|nr:hypothetical protein [Deltaproteobacteria bacterium]